MNKTLLFWKYVITIDDEVELSWIKTLFFMNRYMNIMFRVWDVVSARFEDHFIAICAGQGEYWPSLLCTVVLQSDSILYGASIIYDF
ncbi:uncharacterized protein ARMOST_15478 [Armillaria ostoyae]|uniref:Rab-GAP TBC domain-containing protein n=1 Tax=Armillaria ostoyae TaxID=47428 RepID=A0A284RTG7_ARMOS|nr:uncharacterized protein ARMOST_15478 [Armillaria ostoyae]